MSEFLKPKTGFRKLRCFQKAECIYDITYYFVRHYLERGDRTCDQMVQAARSGKQNIVEGRSAATTSRETEIKLYNVALASLHELMVDYEDYLRTRQQEIWKPGHPRFEALHRVCLTHNDTEYYAGLLPRCKDYEIANLALTLIHQADKMIGRLRDLAKEDFLRDGGIKEQMYKARIDRRNHGGASYSS